VNFFLQDATQKETLLFIPFNHTQNLLLYSSKKVRCRAKKQTATHLCKHAGNVNFSPGKQRIHFAVTQQQIASRAYFYGGISRFRNDPHFLAERNLPGHKDCVFHA
jgi:hypothetical protein